MSTPWDYIAKIVSVGDSGAGKSSLTVRLCEETFSSHHDVTIGVEFGSRIVPVGPPASEHLRVNDPVVYMIGSSADDADATSHTTSTNTTSADASTPPTSPTTSSRLSPFSAAPDRTTNAKSPNAKTAEKKQKYMKLSLWDTAGQETYKSITRSYFRGASGALLVFDITRRGTFANATSWLHDLRAIADEGIVVVLVGNKSDLPKSQRQVSSHEATEWARDNGILAYVETSAKSGEGVERAFREVAERIYQGIEAGRYDLDDRRSGVKRAAAVRGAQNTSRITVGMEDGARYASSGCC